MQREREKKLFVIGGYRLFFGGGGTKIYADGFEEHSGGDLQI